MGWPGLAKTVVLAVIVVAGVTDAQAGAVHASWTGWLERLWSGTSGGSAEAALKRQGGSRFLLSIDTEALREAVLIELRDDVRRQLREERIPYADLAARDGSVSVRIREAKDWERARSALASADKGAVEIENLGEGSLSLAPTEREFAERVRRVRQQSMEVIERRLESFGVATRAVQADGPDGIRVLLPGVHDLARARAVFNTRARLTFRLVDQSMTAEEAARGNVPPGSEIVYERNTKVPLLLRKQVLLEGDDIADAAPGFDQRTNEPIVTFRFNANGARRFAHITQENIGRPFAVVLDSDVLAVPIIREPILGGSGQISGGFTLEEANTTAVLLRSGTLPGRLTVVEEQLVAPEGKAAQR
jgi:preprotein translocase subunit SecD